MFRDSIFPDVAFTNLDQANEKKSMKQTRHDLMTTARMRAKQAAVTIRKRPRAAAAAEQH